ncbi:MAG: lysophospholipid acyltransferase family protein [Acinetobacter sp.]
MGILLQLIAWLPLVVLRSIARLGAYFLYVTPSSMKRVSSINLTLAYPDLDAKQHQQLLRSTLTNQCLTYIESIKCWGMSTRFNLNLFQNIEGEQHLIEALANKKGVIVVIAHLGCWELLNVWLNRYTSPMIMYKPNKNKAVNQFILKARERFNAVLVPTDTQGVREIMKHLRAGGLTVILPDHLPKESGGITAPFFGHDVLSTTLISKLTYKTQCNVLGLSCLRNNTHKFNVICQPLSTSIASQDLQTSVNALNLAIEKMIEVCPSQYIWSYKRFRKMRGQEDLYWK